MATADVRGTRAWRELRQKVFTQQGRQCVECGGTEKLEVDHIIPVTVEPSLAMDITNLQVLCKPCNIAKSDNTERKRINWFNREWLAGII